MTDPQAQFNTLHNHDSINSQRVAYKNISGTPVIPTLKVSDGVTTVTPTTEIDFTGATVTNGGSGKAQVSISGGGGSPGGNDTDIQFNNSGAFGGSDNFQWVTDTTLKTQSTYKINGLTAFGAGVTVDIIDTTLSVNTFGSIFLELKASIVQSAGIMIASTGAQIIRAVYDYNTSGPSVTQQVTTTDFTYGNTSAGFTDNGASIIQISLPGFFLQQWAYEVTYFFV